MEETQRKHVIFRVSVEDYQMMSRNKQHYLYRTLIIRVPILGKYKRSA